MIDKRRKETGLLIGAVIMLFTMAGVFGGESNAAEPDNVNFTLAGCNSDGTITLPNENGDFICPDPVYTTGNLGKGWNELDLVPYRLTADAGNSAPPTQTYTIAVVLDNFETERPGYDVLSVPVLNTTLSSSSCSTPTVGDETVLSPGLGGMDKSIYRLVTVTQEKNTTCFYDYYGRLALGSHNFPGASLHANLANESLGTSGIGSREVSIPVKEILPQEVRKDMSAMQDSTQAWSLTKDATQASVSFGDVCSANFEDSKDITIRVKWELLPAVPGSITAITNIYAKNPAARTVRVNVTDNIYKGTTPGNLLATKSCDSFDVPANTESLVCENTAVIPKTAGNVGDYLNDVATATYTDVVTGIAVPGQTTASASAQITAGDTVIASADIADVESISGDGLSFSVASPGFGAFSGYEAAVETYGPVSWQVSGELAGQEAVFNKTLYLDGFKVTTGELVDTATLNASDGSTLTSGPKKISISSSASVNLTICKEIPLDILDTGDRLVVPFQITRANDKTYSVNRSLSFEAGGLTELCTNLTGLVPDSYTVEEQTTGICFYAAGEPGSCLPVIGLQPKDSSQQTVNLSLDTNNNVTACSGTAAFVNEVTDQWYANAKVCKVTNPILDVSDPDYNWTFKLEGPDVNATATAGANGECVFFSDAQRPLLLDQGTYTVTETIKDGWDLISAVPNSGTRVCTFTVDLPYDAGKIFTCTFTNNKRGKAEVVKTVQGQPPTGAESFTFQLRQDASSTQDGTILETGIANAAGGGIINFTTALVPTTQTYQLCESVQAGWLSTLETLVPGSFIPPNGGAQNPSADNSTLCVNFTVNPGETKVFTVDNTPPPGGPARTIGFWKNWASCSNSKGKQDWVLDEMLDAVTPPGIQVGSWYLETGECSIAVHLLSKENCSGKKMASDPLFNMAAQLVGAELNLAAGAYRCPAVTSNIRAANNLLSKYSFLCSGYSSKLSKNDATLANNLANFLDAYNNNLLGVCP